jgi:hypothetical protein
MTDPVIVDAGPALNFFSINKERLVSGTITRAWKSSDIPSKRQFVSVSQHLAFGAHHLSRCLSGDGWGNGYEA